MLLPVLEGCFCSLDLLVGLQLLLVQLQVSAGHDVVVSESSSGHLLYFLLLLAVSKSIELTCSSLGGGLLSGAAKWWSVSGMLLRML